MKRFSLVLVAAAAGVVVAVLPAAGGAGGVSTLAHVTCGQVISVDTTLDADLVCSNTDGIVIGADGITLDLNGHSIIQTEPESFTAGVAITGHEGVTVQNGAIGLFRDGVFVNGGRTNTIRGLLLKSNGFGVRLAGSRLNVVTDNTVFGTGGTGILLSGADSNRITLNRLRTAAIFLSSLLGEASDNNLVKRNLVVGAGISVFGVSNTIRGNTVVRAPGTGIGAFVGSSSAADRTQIVGNAVTAAGVLVETIGTGILIEADDVVVTGNTVTAASLSGILVTDSAAGTVLTGNTAESNGEHGIRVRSADATLTGNHGNFNVLHGIDAEPGVTDGGGNTARHNATPPDCLGVVC
jgi:parallel beta-helix repeat protein